MLEELGAYVIDSDVIARELTLKGSPILGKIEEALGDVITSDGGLDRKKVASIVFTNKEKLEQLESILHPEIQKEYRRRAVESGEEFVFILIPLLFEEELEDRIDEIWLCYAPEETRIERTLKRDGCSREEIRARMDCQIQDDLKLEKSDLVLDTSHSLNDVREQVGAAFDILRSAKAE